MLSWVQVFPNPSAGKFEVNFNKPHIHKTMAVYNLQGQRIMLREVFKESSIEIDLSTYPSGTYLLKLLSPEEVISIKLIRH